MDKEIGIKRVLISENEIRARVQELATQINKDYAGLELTVIIILNGAMFFGVDLLKLISVSLKFDTLSVSSYIGTESSKDMRLRTTLKLDVENKHLLVVDDIFDTGLTLGWVVNWLRRKNPKSVKTCVLVGKDKSRGSVMIPDYSGFAIGDEFVVGYGLDYNELFRSLPFIGILDSSALGEC